ncbi:MAG: phosphatase PAP2 family protein [Acidimicrobiia bacterium]|nr:phosphatase PAP2 family protein [Acidimicrobiia bacterium]
MTSRARIGATAFLLAGLGVLTLIARRAGPLPGDLTVTRALQVSTSPSLDRLALKVSAVGSPFGLALLAGAVVVGLAERRRILDATLVVATGTAEAGTALLRLIAERPRPEMGLVRVVQFVPGTSFPSGHAADAAALAVLLGHLTARWSVPQRVGAWAGLGLFALAEGTVRIYLGAHWASDVLGGYFLGGALGLGLGWLSRIDR